MKHIIIEDPRARLSRQANPDDCWLWCDNCQRFFQYRSALPSGVYPRDACPFDDCYGVGVGFNLFIWDDMREPEDARWPSSVDQLEHGMRSPEMAPFYEAQLRRRIDALIDAFAGSPELAALGEPEPCYLGAFLKMMSDLCWDLTDDDGASFDKVLARELVFELPVWSHTADFDEAPRMTAELRAFFAFAERTGAVRDAARWQELLAADDTDDQFRFTMEHDRRLRPPARRGRPRHTGRARDPRDGMRRTRKHSRGRR